MVQMITNGTKLGTYRPFGADEEMDIRIRYPDEMRDIENMDSLRIMTPAGKSQSAISLSARRPKER